MEQVSHLIFLLFFFLDHTHWEKSKLAKCYKDSSFGQVFFEQTHYSLLHKCIVESSIYRAERTKRQIGKNQKHK